MIVAKIAINIVFFSAENTASFLKSSPHHLKEKPSNFAVDDPELN